MNKSIGLVILTIVAVSLLFVIVLQPTFVDKKYYNHSLSGDCRIHIQTSTRISSLGFRKSVGTPYSLVFISNTVLRKEKLMKVEISSSDENLKFLEVYNRSSILNIDGGHTLRDVDLPEHNIRIRGVFENKTCEDKVIFTQENFFTLRRFSA